MEMAGLVDQMDGDGVVNVIKWPKGLRWCPGVESRQTAFTGAGTFHTGTPVGGVGRRSGSEVLGTYV